MNSQQQKQCGQQTERDGQHKTRLRLKPAIGLDQILNRAEQIVTSINNKTGSPLRPKKLSDHTENAADVFVHLLVGGLHLIQLGMYAGSCGGTNTLIGFAKTPNVLTELGGGNRRARAAHGEDIHVLGHSLTEGTLQSSEVEQLGVGTSVGQELHHLVGLGQQ